jgi:exodeoxyribonuclease-3
VNGLRSVYQKGFLGWFYSVQPEIICLQEIKIQKEQLPEEFNNLTGYYSFFNFALKKGYSGVAVFSRSKPLALTDKLGLERFDREGRFLRLNFPEFTLINIYLPHGSRQKENLPYKLEVYDHFLKYLGKLKNQKIILIGDFNIAHQEIDLARPKQNQKNIMFTPEERKQIDRIIDMGFLDAFRNFHQEGGHYTWWPYFANARARNLGWRIDYAFILGKLMPKLKNAFILPEVKGSDHCPIGVEVNF